LFLISNHKIAIFPIKKKLPLQNFSLPSLVHSFAKLLTEIQANRSATWLNQRVSIKIEVHS